MWVTRPLILLPLSATMGAQKTTSQLSNRAHRPQATHEQTPRPTLSQPQRDTSRGHIPPIRIPPQPSRFAGDSPASGSRTPPLPLPAPHDEDSPVLTTAGRTKWTGQDLWRLALAVHDKQPYTAKYNEKAARWEEVRNSVNETGRCERSTKAYQTQMKRLLSWQQGSKVSAVIPLSVGCEVDQPTGLG